jgi:hypothetical protein
MKLAESKRRIVIAVTETTPVQRLWGTAMRLLADSPAELVTLFVEEDRWRRVASLPFTQEVSRTGRIANFTRYRAEQIQKDAIARARKMIRRLAEKERVEPSFEVLPETDVDRLRMFLDSSGNVLVAPAFISSWPVYRVLAQFDCTILLVEVPERQAAPDVTSAGGRPTQTR